MCDVDQRQVVVGAEDGRGAVLVLEVELREERGLGAPLVGGAQDADLAAVPAVGEEGAEHVPARAEQPGHVVGLHLGAVRRTR